MFSVSQLAILNIVAGEVVEKGTCRLTVKEIADRAKTCRRTVQNSMRAARLCGLLVVKRRRLSRTISLPNIVIITSKEWLVWLKRRGAWAPARRIIDLRTLRQAANAAILPLLPSASNKGAKHCAPQVGIRKEKEEVGEHRAKCTELEHLSRATSERKKPTRVQHFKGRRHHETANDAPVQRSSEAYCLNGVRVFVAC